MSNYRLPRRIGAFILAALLLSGIAMLNSASVQAQGRFHGGFHGGGFHGGFRGGFHGGEFHDRDFHGGFRSRIFIGPRFRYGYPYGYYPYGYYPYGYRPFGY
jgi:hypothetical protein